MTGMSQINSWYEFGNVAICVINKCACTSVREGLAKAHCYTNLDKFNREYIVKFPENPDIPKLVLVRNPYARLVSCWADKIMSNNEYGTRYNMPQRCRKLRMDMSFPDFVTKVVGIKEKDSDKHFRSQHKHISKLEIDWDDLMIYRLEEELPYFIETARAHIPNFEMGHVNKSSHKPWQEYYNSRLTGLVYERYKRDFELFGYER